ncbi:MAG: hypothetical protein IRZ33_11945 [Alicyclobacillaceae bacterium]|nr:hypothetical protein [Alicyclobacillaceae bacterium]
MKWRGLRRGRQEKRRWPWRRLPGMPPAALIAWSARRLLRDSRWRWGQLRLLVDDWITAVYVALPAAVAAGWLIVAYVRRVDNGRFLFGPAPSPLYATAADQYNLVLRAVLVLFLGILHLSSFGGLPIPLEPADRLFLLPHVRRRWVVGALWAEGVLRWAPCLFAFLLLLWPLSQRLGVPAVAWFALGAAVAAYESCVRMVSSWLQPGERFRWRRWLVFQFVRVVTFIPLDAAAQGVLSGWGTPAVISLAGAGLAGVGLAAAGLGRVGWDRWFGERPSRMLLNLLPDDPAAPSRTLYYMRRPSAWLARCVDRRLGRRASGGLHPVTWLLLVRVPRRPGVLRDLGLLTAAFASTLAARPPLWAEVVVWGFCVFLAGQWWELTARPLYEGPVREQLWADRWSLREAAVMLRNRFAFALGVLWLCLWVLMR